MLSNQSIIINWNISTSGWNRSYDETSKDPKGHNYGFPQYQGKLNNNVITIAEALGEVGYSTLMSGVALKFFDKSQWPLQRGFEYFYGFIAGAGNFFKPEAPRLTLKEIMKLILLIQTIIQRMYLLRKQLNSLMRLKIRMTKNHSSYTYHTMLLIGHCRLQKKILTSIEVIILKDGKNLGRKDIIA